MLRPPRRNLPPDSQEWGRFVEDGLMDLDRRQSQTDQSARNNNLGLGGSLNQLSGQVATLTTQQGVLAAQQETLATQQATLTDLVNTQIKPSGANNTQNGYSIGTTWATLTSVSLPSGVTWANQAYLSINGFMRAELNSSYEGGDWQYFMRFVVNGVASGVEYVCNFDPILGLNTVSGSHFRTTLVGGTNTVALQARSSEGTLAYPFWGPNTAVLEATALYLR